MVAKLGDIQSSLPMEYRNDTIFRKKLHNDVHDLDECRPASRELEDAIQGVTSDLHASLVATLHPKNISIRFFPSKVTGNYVTTAMFILAGTNSIQVGGRLKKRNVSFVASKAAGLQTTARRRALMHLRKT